MSETPELTAVPSTQLLRDIKVVELSRHVAGSYCGKILAQLGASVSRFGPEIDVAGSSRTRQAMQRVLHAAKQVLPLSDKTLQAELSRAHVVIVEKSDRDDDLSRHIARIMEHRTGLEPDAMLLVLSACGSTDGYRPGCGLTSSAWGAMSWVIGEPSRDPLTLPYDVADGETGASAAAAAIVALLADVGTAGALIDVSSRDVLSHFVSMLAQSYVPYGRPWHRDGRRPFQSGGIYPMGLFPCKDGYVALFCRGDLEWRNIVKAMGNPEWSRDERFKDPRVIAHNHSEEADSYLLPWLAAHTKDEITNLAIDHGFAAAPVRLLKETLEDPQFAFRGSFEAIKLDGGASVMVPSEAWRLYEGSAGAAPRTAMPGIKPWPVQKTRSAAPSQFLKGLRVIDFSWVWSGPLVCSILADLGAEVYKIEHPSRLDSVRTRGRSLKEGKPVDGPVEELNPWFNQLNHGKRSVVLDIKSPEGRAEIHKLAATCDVVVENMRPGALTKLNLGYTDFIKDNPSIVMLSMSFAGQAGPLSRMMGYAGIMSSMAGLDSVVGYREPDGKQTPVGLIKTGLGDPNAATHAICVLMAALYRKKLTGRGLWIDLSQRDAILSILAGPLVESQLYGEARLLGTQHPLYAPHGHFTCKGEEKWVAVSVQTEQHWQQLLAVAKDSDLPLFAGLDASGRLNQRRDVEQALEAWTRRKTSEEVVAALMAAAVPVAPVATYQSMCSSSWRQQRGLTRIVNHPFLGKQEIVVPPWRFGNQSPGVEQPAPLLGADTDDVLAMLNGAARAAK